jgi:YD repeat-containing protein
MVLGDPSGTYTMAYDAAGRTTSVQEPFGLSLTFAYDGNGNRTRVDDSKGGVTTSVYDAADRLSSRELGGSGITKLKVSWGYDERDQVTGEYRWKWAASAWSPASTSTYAYDTSGRLTDLRHLDGSGHRK